MVAPLFVIALLWERYDWSNSALLRGRSLSFRVFGHRRTVHSTSMISGVLLVAMGVLVTVLAFTETAMPRGGWQVRLSARLQHYASIVLSWVDSLPGWIVLAVLLSAIALLARRAIRQHLDDSEPAATEDAILAAVDGPEGEP